MTNEEAVRRIRCLTLTPIVDDDFPRNKFEADQTTTATIEDPTPEVMELISRYKTWTGIGIVESGWEQAADSVSSQLQAMGQL